MISSRTKIEGVPELLRHIKETGKDIHKACKRGIDRTALAIESDAKRQITADGHIVTGRLRASIHAELEEGKGFDYEDNNGESFDGSLDVEIGELEAVVGTNVFYGVFIELKDSFLMWVTLKNRLLIRDRILQELGKIRR